MKEYLINTWDFILDHIQEIGEQTMEHIWLTMAALMLAILFGTGIGIFVSRRPQYSRLVLGFTGVLQTIPSLALLGFMIPLLGIGEVPAIVALFLYALLPIVRNTFTGITEVDPAVREAAMAMGMTNNQLLVKVELPLATPVIFAGIRTAVVISVGVATLCALIAAGGLGEFIFRGIALNNVYMIIAGALPAALLALTFDGLLAVIQSHISRLFKPLIIGLGVLLLGLGGYAVQRSLSTKSFVAGFPSEFMEREDGYQGLRVHYDLNLNTVELEIGLMYQALRNGDVDVISGFSTDGRIKAYNLRVLKDDQYYFPPYFAATLVSGELLRKYPEVGIALDLLSGKIDDLTMSELNYKVDQQLASPREVAGEFLNSLDLLGELPVKNGASIVVGSKNFTESFILAEMMAMLIDHHTGLQVTTQLGFGGTKLCFDALRTGGIDLYPEYTGTGLLVLLQPKDSVIQSIIKDPQKVYDYLQSESQRRFDLRWTKPLGFNNTHAMMMREKQAQALNISTISELRDYLQSMVY